MTLTTLVTRTLATRTEGSKFERELDSMFDRFDAIWESFTSLEHSAVTMGELLRVHHELGVLMDECFALTHRCDAWERERPDCHATVATFLSGDGGLYFRAGMLVERTANLSAVVLSKEEALKTGSPN